MKTFTFAALGVSNFSYQWLFQVEPDYLIAFERTYFMGASLIIYHMVVKIKEAIK